jgi:hypothetical protein
MRAAHGREEPGEAGVGGRRQVERRDGRRDRVDQHVPRRPNLARGRLLVEAGPDRQQRGGQSVQRRAGVEAMGVTGQAGGEHRALDGLPGGQSADDPEGELDQR